MTKGRGKQVAKSTTSRSDKRGGRVFRDVCAPCAILRGKKYMLLVKQFSLQVFCCVLDVESKYFKEYIAGHRCLVLLFRRNVRTDDAAEFK